MNGKEALAIILDDSQPTTQTIKPNILDAKSIYHKALQAGQDAMKNCTPTPMVVQQHTDMLDDNSPVEKQWYVRSSTATDRKGKGCE